MAHKKATGSTTLGRDSHGQRLGVKVSDGSYARAGQIVVRQRGTKIHPAVNVRQGSDDTLYAALDGIVQFNKKRVRNFTGALVQRTFASIKPVAAGVKAAK